MPVSLSKKHIARARSTRYPHVNTMADESSTSSSSPSSRTSSCRRHRPYVTSNKSPFQGQISRMMQRRLTVVPRLSSSNRSSSPGALLLLSILLLISLSLLGCWGSFQLGKQTRLVFHRRYQHHKLVPFSPSGEGALLSQTRDDSRVTSAGERSIQKYHPQESPLSMKNHSRVDSLVAVNKSLLTTTRRVLKNVRATSAGQGKKTIVPSSLEWNSESRKRRHVDNMLVRTAAYYEVFVHTALLLQDERKKPRRVAIIVGGGHQHGGAMILREVLKHVTVEEVVMIGGTPTHSSSSSFWNDCSELKGSPKLCSDDPRITNGDETLQSFILQFQLEEDVSEDELFDVILVDTLDLTEVSDLSQNYDGVLQSLSRALVYDGFLVMNKGLGTGMGDKDSMGSASLIDALERVNGFEHVVTYDHNSDGGVFLLAMKHGYYRASWYANEAEWNHRIHTRIQRSRNGDLPLLFFDSATMQSNQFPSRLVQDTWCKGRADRCVNGGQIFDPEVANVPATDFLIKPSLVANGGRGVFSKAFIPKGSYLGVEECVESIFVPPIAYMTSYKLYKKDYGVEILEIYLTAYGWLDMFYNESFAAVEPGILTFMNHGCNGTYNSGGAMASTEMDQVPAEMLKNSPDFYNPYVERQNAFGKCNMGAARRDIEKGEEVLCNYMKFLGPEVFEGMMALRRLCAGEGVGEVAQYEHGSSPPS